MTSLLSLLLLSLLLIINYTTHASHLVFPSDNSPASPDDAVLQIAYIDWSSTYNETDDTVAIYGDPVYTQAVSAMMIIAANHFNERRVEVVPDLASVASCNKNVTIIKMCDTSGYQRRAASDSLWLLTNYHVDAVVGYGGTDDLISGGIIPQQWSRDEPIPIISHWVTDPQAASRTVFPAFARTIPSDDAAVTQIASLITQFNYPAVAILYLSDGVGFARELSAALATSNVSSTGVVFSYSADNDNIEASVKAIADLNLNIIVCATFTAQLPEIADAAAKYGLLDPDRLWIFTYLGNYARELNLNDNVKRLMHGSLFPTVFIDNANWETFKSEFASYSKYIPEMNTKFPPFNDHNDSQHCGDYSLNYTIPDDFFSPETLAKANTVWGYAYDAVMSFGFAACATNPTSTQVPSGRQLYTNLMNVDFAGLSGDRVRYNPETGDRDPNTAGFKLLNFVINPSTDEVETTEVGAFDYVTGMFNLSNEAITFKSNLTGIANLPIYSTLPLENRQYLPNWAKSLGYAEVAIVQITVAGAFAALVGFRHDPVIVNSQPPLLALTLLGVVVASWSIFTLTVDDDPSDPNSAHASQACMAGPALYSFGMTLTLAAITSKAYRIYTIFVLTNKLRRIRFGVGRAVRFVAIALAVLIVVLVAWIIVAPLTWHRQVIFSDAKGNPLLSSGTCVGTDASLGFVGAVVGLFALALICAAISAYVSRDLSPEYQESRWIALVTLSMVQIFLVGIPAVVAVWSAGGSALFLLLSTIVFVNCMVIVVLLFGPKLFRIFTKRDLWGVIAGSASHGILSAAHLSVRGKSGGNAGHASMRFQQQQQQQQQQQHATVAPAGGVMGSTLTEVSMRIVPSPSEGSVAGDSA